MTPDDVRASRVEWITAYLKADPSLVREVLEQLGAEEQSLWSWNEKATRKTMEPGRYMVWRLPEEGTKWQLKP